MQKHAIILFRTAHFVCLFRPGPILFVFQKQHTNLKPFLKPLSYIHPFINPLQFCTFQNNRTIFNNFCSSITLSIFNDFNGFNDFKIFITFVNNLELSQSCLENWYMAYCYHNVSIKIFKRYQNHGKNNKRNTVPNSSNSSRLPEQKDN